MLLALAATVCLSLAAPVSAAEPATAPPARPLSPEEESQGLLNEVLRLKLEKTLNDAFRGQVFRFELALPVTGVTTATEAPK